MDLEQRQLRDGEYVAVRRFTRILERGPDAKATVDEVGAVDGGMWRLVARLLLYQLAQRQHAKATCSLRDAPLRWLGR